MNQNKRFFLFFLLLASFTVNAQFKKGDKMLGTSIASILYNTGGSDISATPGGNSKSLFNNYSVSIIPQMGWFLSGSTVVGFTADLNPYGQKNIYKQNGLTYQSDKASGLNLGVGGFVRNYFKKTGKYLPFAQAGANLGITNYKTDGFFYGGSGASAYKQTYTGNSSGGFFANGSIQAGITKMMGENAGLELYIGYTYSYINNKFKRTTLFDDGNNGTIDSSTENVTTTKYTNHGFMIGLGFQIFLRKK